MKNAFYRTFTWATIGTLACATSFVAGAVVMAFAQADVPKKETFTEDHLPK